MAKKQPTINTNLFGSTQAADPQPEETEKKKNYPISVYLTHEEREELEGMAASVGLTRHALLQFALKDFIKRFRAGEIKAVQETVKVTVLKAE